MTNLLLALFLIVFEAVPEGLADRGFKTLAGVLEALKLAVITVGLFLFINGIMKFHYNPCIWYILTGYLFTRFAIFDILYNASCGLYLDYVGTTKLFDKIYGKITKKMPFSFILFAKCIFLAVGISMLLKH